MRQVVTRCTMMMEQFSASGLLGQEALGGVRQACPNNLPCRVWLLSCLQPSRAKRRALHCYTLCNTRGASLNDAVNVKRETQYYEHYRDCLHSQVRRRAQQKRIAFDSAGDVLSGTVLLILLEVDSNFMLHVLIVPTSQEIGGARND